MDVEAVIHIKGPPEFTLRSGRVMCEGRQVGRILKAEVVDDPTGPYARMNMQIDDRAVKDAVLNTVQDELRLRLREIRDEIGV